MRYISVLLLFVIVIMRIATHDAAVSVSTVTCSL